MYKIGSKRLELKPLKDNTNNYNSNFQQNKQDQQLEQSINTIYLEVLYNKFLAKKQQIKVKHEEVKKILRYQEQILLEQIPEQILKMKASMFQKKYKGDYEKALISTMNNVNLNKTYKSDFDQLHELQQPQKSESLELSLIQEIKNEDDQDHDQQQLEKIKSSKLNPTNIISKTKRQPLNIKIKSQPLNSDQNLYNPNKNSYLTGQSQSVNFSKISKITNERISEVSDMYTEDDDLASFFQPTFNLSYSKNDSSNISEVKKSKFNKAKEYSKKLKNRKSVQQSYQKKRPLDFNRQWLK